MTSPEQYKAFQASVNENRTVISNISGTIREYANAAAGFLASIPTSIAQAFSPVSTGGRRGIQYTPGNLLNQKYAPYVGINQNHLIFQRELYRYR